MFQDNNLPPVIKTVDISYSSKRPASTVEIDLLPGDIVEIDVVGPLTTTGRTYSFTVVTKWESSHKKGCKRVKETHEFPRKREKETKAHLFEHYWPVISVPSGPEGSPAVVQLKANRLRLVPGFRGKLTAGDLVIPEPYLLYLVGGDGNKLTPDEIKYKSDMEKSLPAPNHSYVRTEKESIQPGTVSLKVKVTLRRAM